MSIIKINNLVKSFNRITAVDIPELNIMAGEIVGFAGNNGAGKTTLFRLILDLLMVNNGSVLIDKENVSKTEKWKNTTGSYIDTGFLIDFLLPEELFETIAMVYHVRKNVLEKRLAEYEKFMNGEILSCNKFIRDHSSGNKQKIGVISAMMINPKLLILDEPFNYLDPSSQMEIKHLIKKMSIELGTTILISSHNLDHITDISSRIILLEKGIVLKDIENSNGLAINTLSEYFKL